MGEKKRTALTSTRNALRDWGMVWVSAVAGIVFTVSIAPREGALPKPGQQLLPQTLSAPPVTRPAAAENFLPQNP